jgi:predicted transcriptional regulator/rubrerythrin
MARAMTAGTRWVGLVQALVARELVEELGVPTRRAAALLGVAPSAVSQYLSGHRRERLLAEFGTRPEVRNIAHRVATQLAESPRDSSPPPRLILEAAAVLSETVGAGPHRRGPRPKEPQIDRAAVRELRARVAAEQAAVSACMHLAQKARDELTRAIFRQIASDSLRHAEIVASLAVYLEAGTNRSLASGIDRADVEALIRREHEAEGEGGGHLKARFGGVMKLLAESMASDEEKHERLLQGLLTEGFPA